jgi:anti-anti-sigma factor
MIGVSPAVPRQVTTLPIPAGALLCFYTDGLVERPDEVIDDGLERLRLAVGAQSPEAACAEVMGAMVGSEPARDDIALLIIRRQPDQTDTTALPIPSRVTRTAPMPDVRFPVDMVNGVPVLAASEAIDITNAEEFRAALLESAARGPGSFVVDMTRTQFCDTSGLHALVGARKRALTEGGDLLLVASGAAVLRILAITRLDQVFPCFASLEEALSHIPGAAGGVAHDDVSRRDAGPGGSQH